ncbi:hypothetical protein TWF281_000551 [Arthrobotrys megalospora]
MRGIIIASLISALANTVTGVAIPADGQAIEERQVQPISTAIGPAGTSYIYALASPIPANIASQLVAAPAIPTPTTGVLPDGGAENTPVGGAPLTPPVVASGNVTKAGFRSVAYYDDWYIYERAFPPQNLVSSQWTHINVAFWNVGPTGEAFVVDTEACFTKPLLNPNPGAGALHGIYEQIFRMKNQNRNLKILLCIGGWKYAQDPAWTANLDTTEKRMTFAKSVARWVIDLGLDGADLDWEYPMSEVTAAAHAETLKFLRQELDAAASSVGASRMELSIAASVGPDKIQWLKLKEIDAYLDFINIMGYDMAGSWLTTAGHASPFFMATDGSTPDAAVVPAVDMYIAGGIDPRKLNIAMPIYGRAFENTDGPGKPYSGVGPGTYPVEPGIYDYKALPLTQQDIIFEDEKILASWSYNAQARRMVSFDTPRITYLKAKYVKERGLGGIAFWQTSADKMMKGSNLVESAIEGLGGRGTFEQFDNHLEYKSSKYPNVRVYDGVEVEGVNDLALGLV